MSMRTSQITGSGRESLPHVRGGREALPDVREWSGDTLGWPEVAGRPSQMFESGLEALPDVREAVQNIR